ncbi:MAG: extracellular solute-binding protein [Phycisphaeraceae bacterium]|nr:extracellular solute-binding protein [Phycisphaeraceae bacterium]
MKDWLPRIFIVSLLAVIIGVPFLLHPEASDDSSAETPLSSDSDDLRLILLSPHNEQIRYEIARSFNRWRRAQNKAEIIFDWRSSGGTSDLRKQVITEFENAARNGQKGIGKDLFFGGGDVEHNILAAGTVIKRGDQFEKIEISDTIDLSPDLFEKAFPQPRIADIPLYHPEKKWVGIVLSSFGIVFNRDLLRMYHTSEPRTWADLATPELEGWVALADPSHSGSTAAAYNAILRRLGWTEGWLTLRQMFGNARYFTSSATKVPVDISAGEAAMGMSIDFYGRFQAGAIGGDRVGYVDPLFMSAITPDPITLLRGAPHRELALEFIAWLISPEAQALWQRRVGTPGGPEKFALRRQPIRRDMYNDAEMKLWADQIKPYELAKELPPGMPDFYRTVAPITQAMAIDVQDDLKAAWVALLTHPTHPNRAEAEKAFYAMPEELTLTWPDEDLALNWFVVMSDQSHPRHDEAVNILTTFMKSYEDQYRGERNKDRLLVARLRWTQYFRNQYRQVVQLLK